MSNECNLIELSLSHSVFNEESLFFFSFFHYALDSDSHTQYSQGYPNVESNVLEIMLNLYAFSFLIYKKVKVF